MTSEDPNDLIGLVSQITLYEKYIKNCQKKLLNFVILQDVHSGHALNSLKNQDVEQISKKKRLTRKKRIKNLTGDSGTTKDIIELTSNNLNFKQKTFQTF